MYTDWQEASYMYSNVVPQWQRINNGNWRTVEEAVRSAARRRGVTFQVFTGTIGVFKVRQLQFNSSCYVYLRVLSTSKQYMHTQTLNL